MVEVKAFFDKATFTLTYVVFDNTLRDAIVIDPVLDFDPASFTLSQESIKLVVTFLEDRGLTLKAILETHAHADHVTAAGFLKELYPNVPIGIGENITVVQHTFGEFFDLGNNFTPDGRQFDHLLQDGENWCPGSFPISVLFTPGHTPACCSYLIGNFVFTGDALFIPDSGVGRCDFPGGSAEMLYDSITQRLYTLPETVQTFTGHDYQPNGRDIQWQSTIRAQKESNIHLASGTTKEAFVTFRKNRDLTLGAPRLLLPSIQLNINAGRLPAPHPNGKRYLKIPVSHV